jgi:hypothetical protein
MIPGILENIGLLSIMKYLLIPLMLIDLLFTINKAIYTRKEISALDLILNEIEGLRDDAEDRLEALRNDYEDLLAKLIKANRKLFIYGISSRKFPKVIETIRDAGKNLKIYKWFKEDK